MSPAVKTITVAEFALNISATRIIQWALLFHPQIQGKLMHIPVVWNTNLDSSGGNFRSQPAMLISLHPALQREGATAVHETFLHELAHAMQWLVYHEVNHGATWWEMMHQLGQKPRRCHQMNLRAKGNQAAMSPEEMGF